MQANFDVLFPGSPNLEGLKDATTDKPFSESALSFLNSLASSLLNDRASRLFPDVVTFAYFCRKSNLTQLKGIFDDGRALRLGRGVVFHIAPSNVPINFGYSFVAGLLAGNKNIVRVSSKSFPQVDLVLSHMNRILEGGSHADIAYRNMVVRYSHESEANALFSSMAAVRVIWGGDSTINKLRENALPPRSFDICFADRYSIAVINPEAVRNADDTQMKKLANDFYNDTYLFDQNACSAPHVVFWLDSECLPYARKRFWKYIHDLAVSKYNLQPVLAVDKLTAFYSQAVRTDVRRQTMPDNVVVRADLLELPLDIEYHRCAGGYFNEYVISELKDILPIVTPRYQTLAYYGIDLDVLKTFVRDNHPCGIDRIVPIGSTTDFSLVWDGYNLIDSLSRIVSIF